ncbi:SDR family oxidoreductase [Mycolicibacterium tusciae]|uniref:SDR family oxidoreductase n=1 Tax=Mycolicibacterium tusciae TaxID=75922 RepID=UPI00024A1B08|nr:SDR family oxidoreductase [Mycolicibacterium tusciae]
MHECGCDLTGRTAVVTGASRGIGQAIAQGLLRAGADVVTLQRAKPGTELEGVASARGRRLTHHSVDLASEASIQEAVANVLAAQPIDILVNNAGAQIRNEAIDFGLGDLDTTMNINVRAVFQLCQLFGAPMIERGRGKIINLASMLSFQGGYRTSAYAASKGAVVQLTKALCNEWAARGVNVNAVAPGYLATEMTEALRADATRSQEISARIPASRWGAPSDVAGPVVFLASDAAAYVHGAVIPVDGGWLAR